MLFKTHLMFGLLVSILTYSIFQQNFFIFTFFVLIGALLPDLDNPNSKAGKSLGIFSVIFNKIFGHRGITHGVWFPLVMCAAIGYFSNWNFALAIFIGYLSHILIDGLTVQGINLIHPLQKLHISGFVETGSWVETVIFIALTIAVGFLGYKLI